MRERLQRQADDALMAAQADDGLLLRVAEDVDAGDNLGAVRSAWDQIQWWRAEMTYLADACERAGYARRAARYRGQIVAADRVLPELRRMWAGGDVITPSMVDYLRLEISRLTRELERLNSRI